MGKTHEKMNEKSGIKKKNIKQKNQEKWFILVLDTILYQVIKSEKQFKMKYSIYITDRNLTKVL